MADHRTDQEPSSLELPLFQRRKSISLTPLIFGCEDSDVAVHMCPTPDEYSHQGENSDHYALKTPFSENTLTPGFSFEKHRRISSWSLSSFGGPSPLGSSESTTGFSLTMSPSPKDQRPNSLPSSCRSNSDLLVATPSLLDCLPIETLEERMSRWVISDDLDKKKRSPSNNGCDPPLVLKNGVSCGDSRKDPIQWKNNSPSCDSYLNDKYFYICSPCSSGYNSNNGGSPYPDSRSDSRSPIGTPSMQKRIPKTPREQRQSRRNNKSVFEFSFDSDSR